jgi:hypothetical protein
MLFKRCLPLVFNELADIPATLGNDVWPGFIISGLSPDKKRLASLGAQQFYYAVFLQFPGYTVSGDQK